MNELLICWGTRPEYIKLKPVIEEFLMNGHQPRLLYVHQHEDIDEISGYKQMHIEIPQGGNRLDAILYGVLGTGLWNQNKDVTHVMVQGDTATAMAVALSAFNNGKKVVHLEAGLRSYDNSNPWPEEVYRRIISSIAGIHFCPTHINEAALKFEMASGDFYVVGNTSIDNLIGYERHCEYLDNVLITMHRRENHPIMHEWFVAIDRVAKDNPDFIFTLPLHRNPDVRRHAGILKHVNVIDPLSHNDLLHMLTKVKAVITDSGGLQEECSYLNKRCFVCRKTTERPEVDGMSTIMVREPSSLYSLFTDHINDYDINFDCPYGDGDTAKRVYNILKNVI